MSQMYRVTEEQVRAWMKAHFDQAGQDSLEDSGWDALAELLGTPTLEDALPTDGVDIHDTMPDLPVETQAPTKDDEGSLWHQDWGDWHSKVDPKDLLEAAMPDSYRAQDLLESIWCPFTAERRCGPRHGPECKLYNRKYGTCVFEEIASGLNQLCNATSGI